MRNPTRDDVYAACDSLMEPYGVTCSCRSRETVCDALEKVLLRSDISSPEEAVLSEVRRMEAARKGR